MLFPETELPKSRAYSFDSLDPTNSKNYSNLGLMNFNTRTRRKPLNHEFPGNYNLDGLQFQAKLDLGNEEEDDSGICSPPMWKSSPPSSPKPGNSPLQSQFQYPHFRYLSMSPTARTQAIARGRRELMDMVKNMPESSYELSLKDLVEKPSVEERHESVIREESERKHRSGRREKSERKTTMHMMTRSGSIDNEGFLLKMVLPATLRSETMKKKKKGKRNLSGSGNCSSKVSPKPEGSERVVDKEWWKKRFSVSMEGESRNSRSGSSGSSSGSSRSSSNNGSLIIVHVTHSHEEQCLVE
ncbi:hypothetical protein RJ641_031851 [Dillenia turbinata]|uniref:Uncharacterized protein n=1 Tax=Dillenia turbinata TaxID=194707 RepID=A0AAN8ZL91_9MAGN